MADFAALEKEASDKRAEAARAEQVAQDKEKARKAAAADYALDPNPATAAALQTAIEESRDAASAAGAASAKVTQAVQALNQARLDDAREKMASSVAPIALAKNPNGITIDTDFNLWFRLGKNLSRVITNNATIRIGGAEDKVVIGAALSLTFGLKNEVCLLTRDSFIVGFELKRVFGADRGFILGMKRDTVGGAKWDEVNGGKYENHHGVKITRGPDFYGKHPAEQVLAGKIAKKITDSKLVAKKFRAEVKTAKHDKFEMEKLITNAKEQISKVEARIKKLEQTIGTYKLEVKSCKCKCSELMTAAVDGDVHLAGGSAKVNLTGDSSELGEGSSSLKCLDATLEINAGGKIKIL